MTGGATTGDPALDTMLTFGFYGGPGNMGTLNNLAIDQAYTVLVLLDDTRGNAAGGSVFHVTDGVTVSPGQQYAFVPVLSAVQMAISHNGGREIVLAAQVSRASSQPPVSRWTREHSCRRFERHLAVVADQTGQPSPGKAVHPTSEIEGAPVPCP